MRDTVDLVTLLVDDLSTARDFYRDVIGFAVRLERETYVEFVMKGVRLALYPRAPFLAMLGLAPVPRGASSVTLSLACEDRSDVDGAYADAVARGATSVQRAGVLPWGGYAAFVRDPSGNVIEFHAA